MICSIRFFNDDAEELIEVDCTPNGQKDEEGNLKNAEDIRQDHIDRLWEECNRENRFYGAEWV